MASVPITISYGDEPELLDNTLDLLRECGIVIEMHIVASGEDIYRREIFEGVMPETFDEIKRYRLFLKSHTHTPKQEGYVSVMQAVCDKLGILGSMEYFVCEKTPGIGLVVDAENNRITPEIVAEIYNASVSLGGTNFAYTISDLSAAFEAEQQNHPNFVATYLAPEELKEKYAEFDVLFLTKDLADELKKNLKPKFGCEMYIGGGYALAEPLEEWNEEGRGLSLGAAMLLKYAGENVDAWAVYEKLANADNAELVEE